MQPSAVSQQPDHLRPLRPEGSKTPTTLQEAAVRRRSSAKSRNGCVTCKARRIKCDESKPFCTQCSRRNLTCGGYRKDIRFRPVENPSVIANRPVRSKDGRARIQPPEEEDRAWRQPDLLDHEESVDWVPDIFSDLSTWPMPELGEFTFSSHDLQVPWDLPTQLEAGDSGDDAIAIDQGQNDEMMENDLAEPGETFQNSSALDFDADSVDRVSSIFHQQTCHSLSIYDEPDENPWMTMIWPMAKDSEALYHALAAMSYLQLSKTNPSMRERGIAHFQRSTEALAVETSNGSMPEDAAIAATLALGFAEQWDYRKASTGSKHIREARLLLEETFSRQSDSEPIPEISATRKFLTNTWIYMDAIARITSDCGPPVEAKLVASFINDDLDTHAAELDPLMGYAKTMFPIIGRVADLIALIRTRCTPRNSPIVISRARELRNALENWSPAIHLEHVDDPTQNMSDAIQTAEAYRWATLLFLQQAVPELPNLGSVGELGQRSLVYLATIPITSHTMIVHTYPLMVAGSEAIEEEDRQFVRERWKTMATCMMSGVVDRCLEITEEVWRRRDTYWIEYAARSAQAATRDAAIASTSPNQALQRQQSRRQGSPLASNFPISAAFRKGVDTLTRSGNVEYTVKGSLHWLRVMKDWGWEVMLG